MLQQVSTEQCDVWLPAFCQTHPAEDAVERAPKLREVDLRCVPSRLHGARDSRDGLSIHCWQPDTLRQAVINATLDGSRIYEGSMPIIGKRWRADVIVAPTWIETYPHIGRGTDSEEYVPRRESALKLRHGAA